MLKQQRTCESVNASGAKIQVYSILTLPHPKLDSAPLLMWSHVSREMH